MILVTRKMNTAARKMVLAIGMMNMAVRKRKSDD